MQQIRISLRGHAEVLMGKNTMMRKVLRGRLDQFPALEKVRSCSIPLFVFRCDNASLQEVVSLRPSHYWTKLGHFETAIIHCPISKGVSEVSERANDRAQRRARVKQANK